jgi:glycogen debranching enzyme
MTRGVLTYLADIQGKEDNAFRDEAPGKIIHEVRLGELARTGVVPFARYYGTVDATALFVILLYRYWQDQGDLDLVKQLRPNWEAALGWMRGMVTRDGSGLLRYAPSVDGGHTVQSWKDSHDSQSHRDGSRRARSQFAKSRATRIWPSRRPPRFALPLAKQTRRAVGTRPRPI